jgi:UTP--glucose-1-phosphate uridylyltransferase
MKIKAIIPAAGFGTRFLPTTKAIPKELLPIVDKPAIQYIVEEGINSGIKDFVVITSKNKTAIEDHFDKYLELDILTKAQNKEYLLQDISKVIEKANFLYVRQQEQLGLGHAISVAKSAFSGDEHMAVFLPDDIFTGEVPAMAQLIKIAIQEKCNVVAVQEVPKEEASRYGIIDVRRQFSPNLFQVRDLVEKPAPNLAPSNLAIVGRYVLSPNIFNSLQETQAGANGEIQLTDAIQHLLFSGEKVFACKVQGQRFDAGTILGWLKTNIEFALKHSKYSQEILNLLLNLDKDMLVMQGKADALKTKSTKQMF